MFLLAAARISPVLAPAAPPLLTPRLSPQTEYARLENGRFVYRIHRSPMCEYMINFIHKLKHLPEKYMMNSVLENFTILQVPARIPLVCARIKPGVPGPGALCIHRTNAAAGLEAVQCLP